MNFQDHFFLQTLSGHVFKTCKHEAFYFWILEKVRGILQFHRNFPHGSTLLEYEGARTPEELIPGSRHQLPIPGGHKGQMPQDRETKTKPFLSFSLEGTLYNVFPTPLVLQRSGLIGAMLTTACTLSFFTINRMQWIWDMEYVKVQRSGGHFTENLECERLRGAAPSSEDLRIK